jgi:hypothetical protein
MSQVLQSLKTGAIERYQVPRPVCGPSHLPIASRCRLISAGTERVLHTTSLTNTLRALRQ